MSTMLTAANAYQNQLKLMQNTPSAPVQDENTGASFSQMVGDALNNAANIQHTAENMQIQSMTGGNVEIADLVTAVSNAELSLNTVVAIRDKVISAYQNILQMSI